MHCNDNPQAIEVADRKREQGDQGAGGPPRDANEDSIMLPTAALETSPQVPSKGLGKSLGKFKAGSGINHSGSTTLKKSRKSRDNFP